MRPRGIRRTVAAARPTATSADTDARDALPQRGRATAYVRKPTISPAGPSATRLTVDVGAWHAGPKPNSPSGPPKFSPPKVSPPKFSPPKFSPLYAQIQALLTAGLSSGDWKPGEAIPSEGELAQRYGVSQGTVRKAIDAMASDHLLVRRQGKGTFVATHVEARAQFRFLRLAPDDARDETSTSLILSCRRVRAPASIAGRLHLKAGDAVVAIRRVLSFDDVPTVLDDIWLNGTVFRGLTADRIAAYRGPLYGLFESDFATPMTRADEQIRAVAADEEAAEILGVAIAAPLLSVERVSMTYGDRPVELRRGLYRTSAHHYRNTLG